MRRDLRFASSTWWHADPEFHPSHAYPLEISNIISDSVVFPHVHLCLTSYHAQDTVTLDSNIRAAKMRQQSPQRDEKQLVLKPCPNSILLEYSIRCYSGHHSHSKKWLPHLSWGQQPFSPCDRKATYTHVWVDSIPFSKACFPVHLHIFLYSFLA